jgi:transcriptional regulator with XRE-family HTH domain
MAADRHVPWVQIEPVLQELGWGQSDLAFNLGIHRNTISRWAAGSAPSWLLRYLHMESSIKRATRAADSIADFVERFRTPRAPALNP